MLEIFFVVLSPLFLLLSWLAHFIICQSCSVTSGSQYQVYFCILIGRQLGSRPKHSSGEAKAQQCAEIDVFSNIVSGLDYGPLIGYPDNHYWYLTDEDQDYFGDAFERLRYDLSTEGILQFKQGPKGQQLYSYRYDDNPASDFSIRGTSSNCFQVGLLLIYSSLYSACDGE
jgi:hypothetical protein